MVVASNLHHTMERPKLQTDTAANTPHVQLAPERRRRLLVGLRLGRLGGLLQAPRARLQLLEPRLLLQPWQSRHLLQSQRKNRLLPPRSGPAGLWQGRSCQLRSWPPRFGLLKMPSCGIGRRNRSIRNQHQKLRTEYMIPVKHQPCSAKGTRLAYTTGGDSRSHRTTFGLGHNACCKAEGHGKSNNLHSV
jgi:hypothetical protein